MMSMLETSNYVSLVHLLALFRIYYWFFKGAVLPPTGHLVISEDNFWFSQLGWRWGCLLASRRQRSGLLLKLFIGLSSVTRNYQVQDSVVPRMRNPGMQSRQVRPGQFRDLGQLITPLFLGLVRYCPANTLSSNSSQWTWLSLFLFCLFIFLLSYPRIYLRQFD